MPDRPPARAPRNPWKWTALVLTAIAAAALLDDWRLRQEALASAERIASLEAAKVDLRQKWAGAYHEARKLERERHQAEEEIREARLRAERSADAKASAQELLAEVRQEALSADEQAERTLNELVSALDRAAQAETDADIAEEKVEEALNRIRALEESQRQAQRALDEEKRRASAAHEEAAEARRSLQSAERSLRASLAAAERSLAEAIKQHERAEVAVNQANRAAEMHIRSRGPDDEFEPGGLQDYRTLHLQAEQALEVSRKRILEARKILDDAKTGDAR